MKISKIVDLADDLSLALSSESVRIIAPIPGRNVVGIETSTHYEKLFTSSTSWSTNSSGQKTFESRSQWVDKLTVSRIVTFEKCHTFLSQGQRALENLCLWSLQLRVFFSGIPRDSKDDSRRSKTGGPGRLQRPSSFNYAPIREPKKAVGALR